MLSSIRLFMVGDVMLARGVDQILKYSCDPRLFEGNGLDAKDYVTLAVTKNGPLSPNRDSGYIWGDALRILDDKNPDVRMINLENAITTNNTPWPMKGIHYRMHPRNVEVLQAAKIDCCVLSNNHVADWEFAGLEETLSTLKHAGLPYVGAGYTSAEAEAPAVYEVEGKGRVLVFAGGHESSGIPFKWQATSDHCGVNMVDLESSKSIAKIAELVRRYKKAGDVVVFSIHWGGNWGYNIEPAFQKFAHGLIDKAGVDLIHGHSSHHAKGVEMYKGKLIIYGCGDFINDYEGITGYEHYRDDLSLMYFPELDPKDGKLVAMTMVTTEIKHLQVNKAKSSDIQWMQNTMSRECKQLNCDVKRSGDELLLVF